MATIKVSQEHQLPREEAKRRLADFEANLSRFGIKLKWTGDKADFDGTGVSGGVDVTDTRVTVTVKLGLMAKAVGVDPKRLGASIEKRLKEGLVDEPA